MTKNNSQKTKVLFFGTPDFAVTSLEALLKNKESIEVLAVVTAPDKPAGRGRRLSPSDVKIAAEAHDLPILQPSNLKDSDFIEAIKAYEADLFIVVAFRMLPEEVWNMPPLGTINVHASLLPKYRGAAPIHWAIINGEKETGVTTFRLRHEIDTGPLLMQKSLPILEEDTLESMYGKLMHLGADLLIETVHGLQNDSIKPIEQEWSEHLPAAPKIHKQTGAIDWEKSCNDIFNLVRGLNPFPSAFCDFEGQSMKVFAVEKEIIEDDVNVGTMQTDQKSFVKFKAKDGWIHIKEAQLPGKRRMGIENILRGYRW